MKQKIRVETLSTLLAKWRDLHCARTAEGTCECEPCIVLYEHNCANHGRCEECANILQAFAVAEYRRSSRHRTALITHKENQHELLRKIIQRAIWNRLGIKITDFAEIIARQGNSEEEVM